MARPFRLPPARSGPPPRPSPQPRVERPRYVAFRLTAARPVPRPSLIHAIRLAASALPPEAAARTLPWLTRFDGAQGILKCGHDGKNDAIALLRGLRSVDGVPVEVRTVGTAGTIAACVRKFLPGLRDEGDPRAAATATAAPPPSKG